MSAPLRRVARALTLAALCASSALAQVGTNYCTPAIPNSTGAPAVISGSGSAVVTLNNLVLTSSGLPLNSFGFFLTSRDQGNTYPVSNSQGRLCLGGLVGRYVGPGQIKNSGATGSFALALDLTAMAHPFSPVVAQPGQTWYFQAWHRDSLVGGGHTSNFTNGLAVLFTVGNPAPGMALIPAGTFLMGSNAPNSAPYSNNSNQQPVHQVTISRPFWMGQHEVTQAEYQALMGTNPSHFLGTTRPVERVSWDRARVYCSALTALWAGTLPSGYVFRLPTEAEWEYACRAGTTTEFHYGPDLLCNQAWFLFSRHSNPPAACNNTAGTTTVGNYAPNAFGLHDMHGNVWEWCSDSYAAYSSAAVTDPFVTGHAYPVLRGGSWDSTSNLCRSAFRNYYAGSAHYTIGFRVVLAPVLVP